MSIQNDLDFITVESLLSYGQAMVDAPRAEGSIPPLKPKATKSRIKNVESAKQDIKQFVSEAQKGFATATDYRSARQSIIDKTCKGDALIFFAAWNHLLAEGSLNPLLSSPIGSIQKPLRRRPTSIVPRDQMTTGLIEGRIVIDLGDDRFWLVPKGLENRSLLFTLRHGLSKVDSGTYRVGRRLANVLDQDKGVSKADAVGKELAKMLGIVGQQLEFLNVPNYLEPKKFKHKISSSPNTRELFSHIVKSISSDQANNIEPEFAEALESQDFGWVTGVEKKFELKDLAICTKCLPRMTFP